MAHELVELNAKIARLLDEQQELAKELAAQGLSPPELYEAMTKHRSYRALASALDAVNRVEEELADV